MEDILNQRYTFRVW